MNIHLTHDEKFINTALDLFERYYPGQNLFFIQVPKSFKGRLSHVRAQKNVIPIALTRNKAPELLLQYLNEGDNVFVHFLNPIKAAVVLALQQKLRIRTYWIFYGGDLYTLLQDKNAFAMVDEQIQKVPPAKAIRKKAKELFYLFRYHKTQNQAKEDFIKSLDYFCFWNPYDYELLTKHFNTSAQFREFRYFAHNLHETQKIPVEKQPRSVLINHSASVSGNHLTVLQKLAELNAHEYLQKLLVPLSYGAKHIKKQVLAYGKKHFEESFSPLTVFLPRDEYFKTINSVEVAIFGHTRQQGGGNLYQLLASGVKIFLRAQNNLLQYFRDEGYYIYEFESDLNSLDAFRPLEEDKKQHNRELALKEYSQEEIDRVYRKLID